MKVKMKSDMAPKMKYAGHKVNINEMDSGLMNALKISEILRGFKKEDIDVEVDTQWLKVNEDKNHAPFAAVIFDVSLPKKNRDDVAAAIISNFANYAGKHAIYQWIAGSKVGDTLTLIYALGHNISDLLGELSTIKSLDIRGEKFSPLAENDPEFDSYILRDCTLSYRSDPEDYQSFTDFMPGMMFTSVLMK